MAGEVERVNYLPDSPNLLLAPSLEHDIRALLVDARHQIDSALRLMNGLFRWRLSLLNFSSSKSIASDVASDTTRKLRL